VASIPLNEVPKPTDLRDLISRNWAEYRTFRNGEPPEELRATSWADGENNSPSHTRGRAIDVVTPDWSQRGYLPEFALWMALRYEQQNVNVIWYRRDFQPHLHIADWSGRQGKPEASIGFNLGGAGKYTYFMPPYSKDVQGLFTQISQTLATYTENTAQADWDFWAQVIRGERQPPWQGSSGWKSWLKRYWWMILLPIVVAIPLYFWYRNREE